MMTLAQFNVELFTHREDVLTIKTFNGRGGKGGGGACGVLDQINLKALGTFFRLKVK